MSPGVAGGPTTASALAGPGARTSAHYQRWVAAVVIAGALAVMARLPVWAGISCLGWSSGHCPWPVPRHKTEPGNSAGRSMCWLALGRHDDAVTVAPGQGGQHAEKHR